MLDAHLISWLRNRHEAAFWANYSVADVKVRSARVGQWRSIILKQARSASYAKVEVSR